MNNKITLPEFVDAISKVSKKPKKVCELFVKEFFAAISDELIKSGVVKVKNIGTFKKVDIEARKSVNVNTGEAVEIPKHYRVTFIPTKEIQDAINAPFLCFETIALNENLTDEEFNDIKNTNYVSSVQDKDNKLSEDSSTNQITEENVDNQSVSLNEKIIDKVEEPKLDEQISDSEKNTVVEEPILDENQCELSENLVNAKIVDKVDNTEKNEESVNIYELENVEAIANVHEIEEVESLPNDSLNDNKINHEVLSADDEAIADTVSNIESKPESLQDTAPIEQSNEQGLGIDSEIESHNSNNGILLLFIGFISGIIITMIIVILISIFSDSERGILKTYNDFIGNFRVEEDFTPEVVDTISAISISAPAKSDTLSIKKDTVASTINVAEKKVNKSDSVVYDYIASSVYLTTLARRHYGNTHFWVYIYEENKSKIPNPNLVRPGTKLVIPPPAKYSIDAKSPESLNKAKTLEGKIQSQFSK